MTYVTLRVRVALRGSGLEHVGEWRPENATPETTRRQLQERLDQVMIGNTEYDWLALLSDSGNGIRVRLSDVASYTVERAR